MIRKIEILKNITDVGVVAVVRGDNAEMAEKTAEACIKGGISPIEMTFTVPGADKVISNLKSKFSFEELVVGAGTVLDSETARIAILAGAQFIVSPAFSLETAKLCNRYEIPYIPGCMTVKEIITAMEAGSDVIKVFPGAAFGPSIIKDFKAPIPQASFMPSGGVSLDNVGEWIKNGCVAVSTGGSLTAGAKTGDYNKVTETAKLFVEKVKDARENS